MLRAQEMGQNSADVKRFPRLPALLELNPRDAFEDIDSIGKDSDDHKRVAFGEELLGHPLKGSSESLERLKHTACVLRRRVHSEIEVLGSARFRVDAECVSPNNQILDLPRIEGF